MLGFSGLEVSPGALAQLNLGCPSSTAHRKLPPAPVGFRVAVSIDWRTTLFGAVACAQVMEERT